MPTMKLEKGELHPYFDAVSRTLLRGKRTRIEVAAIPLGDQIEVEWLLLIGVVYDCGSDVLHVLVEGHVDHMIGRPLEVYIDAGAAGLQSMLVVAGDGTRHIVQFRDPLMLPATVGAWLSRGHDS